MKNATENTQPLRLCAPARPRTSWPNGKRLAVYLALNLEHFAFGEGLGAELAPGGPQPDVLNYAWRDYGNRVGAWRLLELFERSPADLGAGQLRDVRLRARAGGGASARAATRSSATAAPTPSGRATLDEADERALIARGDRDASRSTKGTRAGRAGSARGSPRAASRPTCCTRPATPICSTGAWTTSRSGCGRAAGGRSSPCPIRRSSTTSRRSSAAEDGATDFADMIVDKFDEMLEQSARRSRW